MNPRKLRRFSGDVLRVISGAAIVLICFCGSSCSSRESNVEKGNREQVLHRGIGPSLADLDPHLATGTTDYIVLSALFEGLVAEDPVDLHPVPGVAERWEVSADGLVYTFYLRANAKWSNGDPVTAADFLGSWQRVLTPSFAADYANLLYVVRGAQAFHQGQLKDFSAVGFSAPDPRVVRITLEQPTPYFLSLLQHWMWYPVHLKSISAIGSPYSRGTAWARPGKLVGNGPFTLQTWESGQRIVVAKSPTYWDADAVKLQAINFYPYESVDAEERAFRAGQLHLTEAMPVAKIDRYRDDEPELLRIDPYLGTYFYRLNTARPFLNDPKIRQALNLAVDRASIVENILQGAQSVAGSLVPPGTGGYTPPSPLHTDFDAARALLVEAGYPGGNGAPTIELLFNSSENHRLIAEAIQEMWRRELGLDVALLNMEFKTTLEARRVGNYQVLRSSWIADYADPSSFLDVWRSSSSNNYTGWSSPAYDKLLFEAERLTDPAARFDRLQRAETLLLGEAPILPIYHYTHVFLIRPSVLGWHPTLLDHHPYKFVSLQPPSP